jgi:hypothetical protein
MTYAIHASRNGQSVVTMRISPIAAVKSASVGALGLASAYYRFSWTPIRLLRLRSTVAHQSSEGVAVELDLMKPFFSPLGALDFDVASWGTMNPAWLKNRFGNTNIHRMPAAPLGAAVCILFTSNIPNNPGT